MKTNIQELIEATDRLCASLDAASQNEQKFCDTVLMELERMSWETLKISTDLKQIQNYGA